jgi:serine/threonine-protein kinase
MGEVYLADDLTLGQRVALKFLPEALAADPERLAAFHQEVRIARQVSHPNVCRVYDIGRVNGQQFLSMEYIDGEDLATLLRRIGRLPEDKATEIARQLCAGLAAAHDNGVLHRDLKPANVMVDGQGRARITDFGLAGLAAEFEQGGVRAGTPAYMAPEQLAGDEISIRSDLYALGLVLYETFTGKPAFKAETLAEFTRLHRESSPTSLSTIVPDVDPAVERVILRCIEKDPAERPASALAVAAALPGGDPLAEALAAGETPSPELVAASGEVGGMRPAAAWLCLAAILLGLIVFARLNSQAKLLERIPFNKTPQVLADRAGEILNRLGYAEEPRDDASGFAVDFDLLSYLRENDPSSSRWDALATGHPSAVYFWYRQSPRLMAARDTDGIVGLDDPPPLVPGMVTVHLDPDGRLRELQVVPPESEDELGPWVEPDWSSLFAAADLDAAHLRPATPRWTPPGFCDRREAWVLEDAPVPGGELRVEAGAHRGQPVFFRVAGAWSRPAETGAPAGAAARASGIIEFVLIFGMLGGGLLLALRNIRLGRGDRKSAKRLAWYVFATMTVAWLLSASHVPEWQNELDLFIRALGPALFFAGTMWLVYLAVEPYIRRRAPHRIVSWSRLCSGQLRDPLVGRDILIGTLFAVAVVILVQLQTLIPTWIGKPPPQPLLFRGSSLMGASRVLATLIDVQPQALFNGFFFIFVPILLQVVLRKYWLSIAVFFLLVASIFVFRSENPAVEWAMGVFMVASWIFVMHRYGLLALVVQFYVMMLVASGPITANFSAWYMGQSLLTLALVVGLAIYGFRTALAGRSMFSSDLLRE